MPAAVGATGADRAAAPGEAVAEVPRSTTEEISAAVAAAAKAFQAWSKTPVIQRAKVLFKYREIQT